MKYTMSKLVEITEVPKSTILYYIKEGLLPEAEKIKPNVHKYSEEHINLLKYIKYMQTDINCSISEIKNIIQNENHKLSNSKSMLLPLVEAYLGKTENNQAYTKIEVLKLTKIDEKDLNYLLDNQIISPLKKGSFTSKEVSIINLVLEYKKIGIDLEILKLYTESAKQMVETERKMQIILCDKYESVENVNLWHIGFETFFTAKQYILNRHSYLAFVETFKDEVK